MTVEELALSLIAQRSRAGEAAMCARLLVALAMLILAPPVAAEEGPQLQELIRAAKAEGSVMVYHTSPMPIIGSTFRAFEQKYGIRVNNYHATGTR